VTEKLDINILKDKFSYMCMMEEETETLPKAPDGYEYRLVKKAPLSDKDPSELTPRQLASKKYREKNRQKLNEKKRLQYEEKKKKENQ
jgi:hypothetical protein